MPLHNDYFIIESIQSPDIADGKIFNDALNAMGYSPKYCKIKNNKEIKKAFLKFVNSNYRNLFISSHGDEENLNLINENFNAYDLGDLDIDLKKRRIFLSTCNGGNYLLAKYFIKKGAYSVVGTPDKLEQAVAVPLWATMALLFNRMNDKTVNFIEIDKALKKLVRIYKIKLNYFSFIRNNDLEIKQYFYSYKNKRNRTDIGI